MSTTMDIVWRGSRVWLFLQDDPDTYLVVHDDDPKQRKAGIRIIRRWEHEGIIAEASAAQLCGWLGLVRPSDLEWGGGDGG